jgi:hypothetical protein
MSRGYSPPLQVMAFLATRAGDKDRGPQVMLRSDEAALRLLSDGELAYVIGPRRQELAKVVIDDSIVRGGVVLRDVLGATVSEIVRVVKLDLERSNRQGHIA